ncbi:hypothetical protein Pla175_03530 [Pirellulimonas nuda]|uniref:Uncharacterized protein n=1 Tax=Pirellulimonas nuda TaxID=2528009 RepID=A0A518D6B6_9BACT|nr:hypothetical protein [Pirellulimonas nuda]QDU86999.1 hypothetical protein Pla175_03530 [Pirellulimonas nuda]
MHVCLADFPISPWLAVPGFLVFFAAVWSLASWGAAAISGWGLLAQHYRCEGDLAGPKWRWRTAKFRWTVAYSGCLTFTANQQGLGIAVMAPLRLGAPPLLIPWQDITARRRRLLLGIERVTFSFAKTPGVPMTVGGGLVGRFEAAVGRPWNEASRAGTTA